MNDIISDEIYKINIPVINYNKPTLKLYVPISNGTININVIQNFNKDDKIALVYNLGEDINNSYQVNVYYNENSYININKID